MRKIKQFPKRIQKSLERFGLFTTSKTGVNVGGLYEKFKQSILYLSEKTREAYSLWSRHLVEYFSERPVESITHDDTLQFYYYISETMSEAVRKRHYIQFQIVKEYRRVLNDNSVIYRRQLKFQVYWFG